MGRAKDCSSCEDGKPEVLSDNREAWSLFLASGTQWRMSGGMASTPTGLDYVAVDILRKARKIAPSKALWEKLRVLEAEALTHIHERVELELSR